MNCFVFRCFESLVWVKQQKINPTSHICLFPEGVPDRASKKLFTKDVLMPSTSKFPEPSQKIVSATASRYFIFWTTQAMNDLMTKWGHHATEYMKFLCTTFIQHFWLYCWVIKRIYLFSMNRKHANHIRPIQGIKLHCWVRLQTWSV